MLGFKYSFSTVLLMNGIVYLITLEKQIVLELLKGMLQVILWIIRIFNVYLYLAYLYIYFNFNMWGHP